MTTSNTDTSATTYKLSWSGTNTSSLFLSYGLDQIKRQKELSKWRYRDNFDTTAIKVSDDA